MFFSVFFQIFLSTIMFTSFLTGVQLVVGMTFQMLLQTGLIMTDFSQVTHLIVQLRISFFGIVAHAQSVAMETLEELSDATVVTSNEDTLVLQKEREQ